MQVSLQILLALSLASTSLANPHLSPRVSSPDEWLVDLYRKSDKCPTGEPGDTTRKASIEGTDSICHQIRLPVADGIASPGALGAKLTTRNKNFKLTLFDDTGCTDPKPDVVKDDGTIGCEKGSTGAGWMSFKVEKV